MVTVKSHKRVYHKHGTIAHVSAHSRNLSPLRGFKSLDRYIPIKFGGETYMLTDREMTIAILRAKKMKKVK